MADRVLTGTRVRNRRLDRGMSQVDLARALGISGSYLNLIEHNRRPVGAKLLAGLAQALDVDAQMLEGITAASVLAPLYEAAAAFPDLALDADTAEDLVARYPGWAALIAAQQARITRLEERTDALSNRLAHDTQIATSLHDVISTATAIRATASILVESPDLDADWQSRFHRNIDTDSARLAHSSQALLGFLDMDGAAGLTGKRGARPEADRFAQPLEQAEAVMAQMQFYICDGAPPTFDDVNGAATRALLHSWAAEVAHDCAALPLDTFLPLARSVAFDPARIAARSGAALDLVLRRLAHLPPGTDAPMMGLARCDAAGVVTFQKPVLDFRLARSGAACPLWPLYQALSQPGRALRRVVRLPGPARTPFECFAIAMPQGDAGYGETPRIAATMLVRPSRTDEAPDPVGPGCRVCSVAGCTSRRHPSLV